MTHTSNGGTKRRILFIGDAGVPTGFARVTHKILDVLKETFEVHVLGINFHGNPEVQRQYPYDIWPCLRGDEFGLEAMMDMIEKLGPALIIVQQDPWNFQDYIKRAGNVPVVGIVAVDGKCCRGSELNGLALAVFWTKFGESEARLGGYTGPSVVIPLGVDLDIYRPQDRNEIIEKMGIRRVFEARGLPENPFIVGSVGRNQMRKRLDLTIEYFAEWVHSKNIADACLWLHVGPTGDDAYDLGLLGEYYRISDRLLIPNVNPGIGVSEEQMSRVYNMFSVLFSTTQGEGWGLPMQESMACGTPCVLPKWSALGEWTRPAAMLVDCTSTGCTPIRRITTIGGVMDKKLGVEALDIMYHDDRLRQTLSESSVELTQHPRYRWENIGLEYLSVIQNVLHQQPVEMSVA